MLLDLPADVLAAIAARCTPSSAANLLQTCKDVRRDLTRPEIQPKIVSTITPDEMNFASSLMYMADIFPKASIPSKDLPGKKFSYTTRSRKGDTVTFELQFGLPIDVITEDKIRHRMMQFKIKINGNMRSYTTDHTHMIPWDDFISERYFIYMSGGGTVQILYGYRGQVHADGCITFMKRSMEPEGAIQIHRNVMKDGTMVYNHSTFTPCQIDYTFGRLTLRDLSGQCIRFLLTENQVTITEY